MTELIPGAVISRNGTRAVALDELDEEWFKVTDHASHYVGWVLRLQPRADPCFGKIQASHFFRTMWDQPNQTVRWPENFAEAFPELALIGAVRDLMTAGRSADELRAAVTRLLNSSWEEVLLELRRRALQFG